MHRNHRRKSKFRAKHHNSRYWPAHLIYSCAEHQRESWQQRRSRERDLIAKGRYEELPPVYRCDIYWKYW